MLCKVPKWKIFYISHWQVSYVLNRFFMSQYKLQVLVSILKVFDIFIEAYITLIIFFSQITVLDSLIMIIRYTLQHPTFHPPKIHHQEDIHFILWIQIWKWAQKIPQIKMVEKFPPWADQILWLKDSRLKMLTTKETMVWPLGIVTFQVRMIILII